MSALLELQGLARHFGGVAATDGVSLAVREGEILALIGPNGAGKTTLVAQISGLLAPDAGRILFAGTDITRMRAHARVRRGLARAFQITSIFRGFTVLENLALAVQSAAARVSFWRPAASEQALREEALHYAGLAGLAASAGRIAGALAHGEQRQLEVGLALATRPKLVLLDEPMAGLGPDESARMIELIGSLRGQTTVLLVEHDMDAVFRLADRIAVLVRGRIIADDVPAAIRAHPEVIRAYLGEESAVSAPLLELEDVEAAYGASQVLFGIGFAMQQGEVATLLGRNGMGKTTTVRAIMGLTPARAGSIRYRGERIERWTPDRIARAGIALVPEGRQIFPNLSVRENLVAFAANRGASASPWTLARVFDFFPQLAARADAMGGQLSGGEQQMLAIGRALMTNPRLLILDEATEGLAPLVRGEIWRCLAALKSEGETILVIDKYVQRLLAIADRHCIIERGRAVWQGDSDGLGADPGLWRRYLGV